ncbi:MAG: hypothetical protein HY000_32030 [Planctomycetes bacterium]|nr:hypothetical protein [Planctomycetota bacterium]
MAIFDPLSEADRQEVAQRIGEWIATTPKFADKRGRKIELGESFQVWMLALDQIARLDVPLIHLVRDTRRWHHQIRIDGRTEANARTARSDKPEAGWKMMRLTASGMTQQIDKAIDWLDENAQDAYLVRLLEIPSYQAETFWLQNDEQSFLLLIHIPRVYHALKYKHLYPAAEFLSILSQMPPAEGALIPPAQP